MRQLRGVLPKSGMVKTATSQNDYTKTATRQHGTEPKVATKRHQVEKCSDGVFCGVVS